VTTYTIDATAPDGSELTGILTHTATPEPNPPELHLGVNCSDANLARDLGWYPRMRYQRAFGPTKWPTSRLASLPRHILVHASCDGPWVPAEYRAWCEKLTHPVLTSWKHEPHAGKIAPSEFVDTCEELAEISADYPLVLGAGPVLTRAWVQNGGDPQVYLFRGAKFLGLDTYNNHSTLYREPPDMFDPRRAVLSLAKEHDIQVVWPEWGIEKIGSDPSGEGRARAIRDQVYYLRLWADNAPEYLIPPCVAWWDFGGDELVGADPGRPTLMTLVDQQR